MAQNPELDIIVTDLDILFSLWNSLSLSLFETENVKVWSAVISVSTQKEYEYILINPYQKKCFTSYIGGVCYTKTLF